MRKGVLSRPITESEPNTPNKSDIVVKSKGEGSKKKTQKRDKKLDEDPKSRDSLIAEKRTIRIPTIILVGSEDFVPYPETTDRHCWTDHYPIEGAPWGVPVNAFKVGGKKRYMCVKYVCSLQCAYRAYLLLHIMNPKGFYNSLKLLEELHLKLSISLGIPYKPLEPSPDPDLLEVTGTGDMKINTYREQCTIKYFNTAHISLVHGQEVFCKGS